MTDVQLNGQSLVTTSATTAPSTGTSESWSVTALASTIPALTSGMTYSLVDASTGATTSQQNELIRITACTGSGATTITVTRGADGTTPVTHSNPATFNIIAVASFLNGIEQYLPGGVKTAAFTAAAGYGYQINMPGSLGTQNITLPTAPAQGTTIMLARVDTNSLTTFTSLVRGGSDTIGDTSSTSWVLSSAVSVQLLYMGTVWCIAGIGYVGQQGLFGPTAAVGFSNNIMSRDSNGRSSINDPTLPSEIASRNYVDSEAAVMAPSYAAYSPTNILLNQFDPRRSIYNWKSSNTRWLRRGLAIAARGGLSSQVVIGDSISSGAVSNIGTVLYDRPNSWPMAMRNALAGMGVPIAGTGIVRPIDNTSTDARYTSTGTWTNNGVYISSTVLSSTLTFNPDLGGSIVDVQYYDGANGTFTITINGVVARTVVGSGSGTAWKHARITGQNIVGNQSKIVLTLTVVNTTGAIIAGINVFSPNGGLMVHNIAQSGSRASGSTGVNSWTDVTSTGNSASCYATFGDSGGRTRQVTDAVFNTTTTVTSATAAFTADDIGKPLNQYAVPTAGILLQENTYIASVTNGTTAIMNQAAIASATAQTINIDQEPHVVHLAVGGNDMINGLTLANATAALTTLKGRYPNSDCILHLFHNITTSLVAQVTQDLWAAAWYTLADTLDIPLFDWRDRVGTYAQAQANGVMGDYQVHLKGSGYAMLGSLLAEIIGESSGKTQGVFTPVQDTDFTVKKYVDDKTLSTSTANNATTTTTTETVVLKQLIPANSLKVGSCMDYSMFLHPAATTITTVRVRIGTAGTISDAAVQIMSATAATQTASRYARGIIGVQAIGTSATFIGGGTETVLANTDALGVSTSATSTFDSTKDNYITVTVQNTTSTTTTVYAGRLEVTY